MLRPRRWLTDRGLKARVSDPNAGMRDYVPCRRTADLGETPMARPPRSGNHKSVVEA